MKESNSDPPPRLPSSEHGAQRAIFVTTHWSVVVSAQDEDSPRSAEALETLCRAYWRPLYVYARRVGHSPTDAEDLTQGFFARLLEKDYLKSAAREKGRFRTFLLMALKRFLANEWAHQHAQKRGGFVSIVAMDQAVAESHLGSEASHNLQPDVLFERQWAMILLDRTMARLREEYAATGRARLFDHLRSCFAQEESGLSSYGEIAARLSLTEAAVKMAVHRLRSRYREILRAEIAETVSSPEEIEEEIRYLFRVFSA